jgi:hypothetical protein
MQELGGDKRSRAGQYEFPWQIETAGEIKSQNNGQENHAQYI